MSHSPDHHSEPPYLSLEEAGRLTQGGNELRLHSRTFVQSVPEQQEGSPSPQELIQLFRNARRESVFAVIRPEECLGQFSPEDIALDARHQGVVDQFWSWTSVLQGKIDRALEVASTPIPKPSVFWGGKEKKEQEWAQQMQVRAGIQGFLLKLEESLLGVGPAVLADKIRAHMFDLHAGGEDHLEKIWGEALAMYYAWFEAIQKCEQVLGMEEEGAVPPEFQSQEYIEEQLTRIFGEQVSLNRGQEAE